MLLPTRQWPGSSILASWCSCRNAFCITATYRPFSCSLCKRLSVFGEKREMFQHPSWYRLLQIFLFFKMTKLQLKSKLIVLFSIFAASFIVNMLLPARQDWAVICPGASAETRFPWKRLDLAPRQRTGHFLVHCARIFGKKERWYSTHPITRYRLCNFFIR